MSDQATSETPAKAGWVDLADVVTLAGLGSLGYGLWLVYPPATFIVIGVLLFLLGTGKI